MEDCIFCKIISKEIETPVIYEDANFLVVPDKFPKAEIHILLMPKKHIISVGHAEQSERDTLGDMVLLAKKIASERNILDYRLIFNVGRFAEVPHLHLHLMN